MREIRPYKLPFSKLEGVGFRERKRATVNEGISQTNYIIKNDTLLERASYTYDTWTINSINFTPITVRNHHRSWSIKK
jgi:hypothetical protein